MPQTKTVISCKLFEYINRYITVPGTLVLHSFFTKNNYLWNNYLMIFISWNRERGKLILRNYFPFTVFTKRFIVDVWVSLGFRICQSFQYTGVLNMFLNLNVSGFWTYHGSEYARFTQGFKYAWLCLNVLKSVWMAFVLHLPIVIAC